jgi:hypothetical protein
MKASFPKPLGIMGAAILSVCLIPTVTHAQNDKWLGGTGNWSDASKWSAGVPTASSNVLIDNGNGKASMVTIDIASAACGNLTVDSDDSLTIPSGMTLTVNGASIVNNGAINDNGTVNIASGKSVALSGTGVVTVTQAIISGDSASTLTIASTIQGSGSIGQGGLSLINQSSGLVNANQINQALFFGIVESPTVTNQGLLEATNNGILSLGSTIDNTSGTVSANGGIVGNNGTLENGTVTSSGSGEVRNSGLMRATTGAVLTLSGVTSNGRTVEAQGSGSKVLVPGTFTNVHIITVGCGGLVQITGTLTNFANGILSGGLFSRYQLCGTLQFNGADIVTNEANIQFTGKSGAILDLSNNDGLRDFAQTVRGGELMLQNGKSLTTPGSYTSAGKLKVRAGTSFTVNGTLTVTHSLAQLEGLKMSMSAYVQDSTGKITVTIRGINPGTQYSQLAVSNGASLNGVLTIHIKGGFVPAIGDKFAIITAGAVTGQFSTVNGLDINSNEHFEIAYNPNNVTLTVVSGP